MSEQSIGRLCGPWTSESARAFCERLREIIIREKVTQDALKQPQERPKLRLIKEEGDER